MTEVGVDHFIIYSLTIYKVASLGVGAILCFLGYRLFLAGVWGAAGDLEVKFRKNSLVLKSAAPGTFFALFGTVVIAFTIWKGLELERKGSPNGKFQTRVPDLGEPLPEVLPFSTNSKSRDDG